MWSQLEWFGWEWRCREMIGKDGALVGPEGGSDWDVMDQVVLSIDLGL